MVENKDRTKGKIKQAVADLTDNDKLHREGKLDEMAGKAKDAIDAAREKLADKD